MRLTPFAAAGWLLAASASPLPPAAGLPGPDERALPVTATRHYRMAGRVRPLLFWIGRDDIGLARIDWRRGADGDRGYDFLVGTDPGRAPRALNRWGFISERVETGGGDLFALMTAADAASYEDAARDAGAGGRGQFRAISASMHDGRASSRVAIVRAREYTVHDLAGAVGDLRAATGAAPLRTASFPDHVRPGLLTAVAELIERSTISAASNGGAPGPVVRYLFGQTLYELRLKSMKPTTDDGFPQAAALAGQFEIRTLATGDRTRFDVTWGTRGDLAGVPLRIGWQPRWWLAVDLRLEPVVPTSAHR